MKKITLISIVIFLMVLAGLGIGSNLSEGQLAKLSIDNAKNPVAKGIINAHDINSPNVDIGKLSFGGGGRAKGTFTANEAARHNSKDDCYLIINNKVYDVSSYINYHPAGQRIITSRCGKEVTGIFASIHSNRAWDLLKRYKVGTLRAGKSDATPQVLAAILEALKKANPNAEIVKVRPKAGFYVAKIIYNGELYEVHINSQGKIFKEEIDSGEPNWSLWESDNDDR